MRALVCKALFLSVPSIHLLFNSPYICRLKLTLAQTSELRNLHDKSFIKSMFSCRTRRRRSKAHVSVRERLLLGAYALDESLARGERRFFVMFNRHRISRSAIGHRPIGIIGSAGFQSAHNGMLMGGGCNGFSSLAVERGVFPRDL